MGVEVYHEPDWPHGLRCAACDRLFVDGMSIERRVIAMDTMQGGEPLLISDLVCLDCAVGV